MLEKKLYVIEWGNILSNAFNMSNGIKQFWILSPNLLDIYVDDFSMQLSI